MFELGGGGIALLVGVSVLAGIGITAIGPGGVLMTIGLFALTDLSPADVAGTSIVTHIGTGLVGTLAFWRAGQFSRGPAGRLTRVLIVATLIGVPAGMWMNSLVGRGEFGAMLGVFSGAIGLIVWYRERKQAGVGQDESAAGKSSVATIRLVIVGIVVSAISSLFGLGGPMICVPCLVAVGVPMLPALAAAQAQSILIASLGAVGYLSQGAIDWPLAILVAIPQMLGVVVGAWIAHAVPTRRLTYALAAILVALAPYLALFGQG